MNSVTTGAERNSSSEGSWPPHDEAHASLLPILRKSEQEFANDADKGPASKELELISCHPIQGHQMFPLSSTLCLDRGKLVQV